MGLLDRYVTQVTGPLPDPVPLVGPLLDPDDRILAWARASAVGAAGEGPPTSLARTLPQDAADLYLVVSDVALSAWRWSGLPSEAPAPFYRIAGENIVAAADTRVAAGDGAVTLRVAFVDASSFDFRVLPGQEAFLAACAQRWPGN
ncbi:MAG: hypothetical protein U0R78_06710 [Nocardioidaceae bacterium]